MTTHTIHPFERKGLGVAPFTFIGTRYECYQAVPGDPNCPVQPGGCCDYCGQGIYLQCRIRDARGHEFKVGCDCVRKTKDAAIIKGATEAQKKHDRERRAANRRRKEERDTLRIWTAWVQFDAVRAVFDAQPHPRGFTDRETGRALTLTDWAEWMMAYAGTAGRISVAKAIESTLAQSEAA